MQARNRFVASSVRSCAAAMRARASKIGGQSDAPSVTRPSADSDASQLPRFIAAAEADSALLAAGEQADPAALTERAIVNRTRAMASTPNDFISYSSTTFRIWSAATLRRICTVPLGQRN